MVQNRNNRRKNYVSILIALSLSHCLNDLLQSVVWRLVPLFKDDLGLSFRKSALSHWFISFQLRSFVRFTGIIFDKIYSSISENKLFTLIGLINLAFC